MLLAKRTLNQASRGSSSLVILRWGSAAAVVVWVIFLSALYARAGIQKLGLSGYFGAKDAATPFRAAVWAGGIVVFLAVVLESKGRVFPLVVCLAAVLGACLMAFTTGSLGALASVAFLLTWCALVGEASLQILKFDSQILDGWGRRSLATALGLGVLSQAILGLGLLGRLDDAGFALLFGAGGLLAAAVVLRSMTRNLAPSIPPPFEAAGAGEWDTLLVEYTALGLIAVALVLSFGANLAPQTEFDSLMYHLSLPRVFLQAGGLVQRPDIQGSQLPLGMELIYAPAMRFGGEAAANLMNWSLVPLISAMFWSAGSRWFGRPVGAIAAALFCLMPLVFYESTIAYTDLAMTLYVVASAFCLTLAAEGASRPSAAAAGLLAGFAVSFKLVSAVYVVPLAIFYYFLTVSRRKGQPTSLLKDLLPFTAAGVAAGSPWLVLHWVQLGNPVFPLLNNVFHSDQWAPVNEGFGMFGIGTGGWAALSVWWRISAHPVDFGAPFASWMIGLPVLASLGFAAGWSHIRGARGSLAWPLLTLSCAAVWFLLVQHARYGLPVFALAALPAAAAIRGSTRALPVLRDLSAVGLVALLSLWFASSLAIGLSLRGNEPDHYPRNFLLGRESREQYRTRGIQNYSALEFLERATKGTDDQSADIGDPFNYFVSNPLWYMNTPATLSPFARVVTSGASLDDMADNLLAAKIRWLVVQANLVPDWLTQSVLSPAFLEKHTEIAYARKGMSVYRVVASPQQSFSANLLCNGDFESTEQRPDCWLTAGDARVAKSDAASERGENAELTSANGVMYQTVPICPNTLYHLSELARTDALGSAARVQINWLDKTAKQIAADFRVLIVDRSWKAYGLWATAPAEATNARIEATANSGVVWLDGFEFQSVASRYSVPCDFS